MLDTMTQLDALWDAPVGLALFDADLRYVRVNAALAQIDGVPAAEHVGKTVLEVLPEQNPDIPEQLRRVRDTGVALDVEVAGVTPREPGVVRHWRASYYPVRAEGRVVGVGATVIEITGQKKVEEALRHSQDRLHRLYDAGMFGVIDFDVRGWVSDANDRFLEMVGYTRQDLDAGRVQWDLMTPPEYRSLDEAAIDELRTRGVDTPYEKEFIRKDGSRVPVLVGATLCDDTRQHGIAFALDITEQRRAEDAMREANARLRDADRRKDEFLGVLSHELRNPLAPIRNSLFILDRTDPAGEQSRRARAVIDRQVSHLTRLVDDLLDVTRIGRGKVQLRRAEHDLGELARRAAEDHRTLMQDGRIAFEVQTPSEPLVVHADAARITQIIGNLVQNARKFTEGGGRVVLSVAREDDSAAIRVRDTGTGIDPELLPRLFEPFTQAKQSLARSEGGLGLGLALVKGLAELHGGRVAAVSFGPGAGSEFTVHLPLARGATAGAGAGYGEVTPRRRRRVLVVDDSRDAADSLAELVVMMGHDADVAYDGPSAIEKAEASRPEVILCDIGLPGMSGYEVARVLRARLEAAVRLVAVSGYAQPEDVQRSADAGFDAHVAKPPDPDRIERLLA